MTDDIDKMTEELQRQLNESFENAKNNHAISFAETQNQIDEWHLKYMMKLASDLIDKYDKLSKLRIEIIDDYCEFFKEGNHKDIDKIYKRMYEKKPIDLKTIDDEVKPIKDIQKSFLDEFDLIKSGEHKKALVKEYLEDYEKFKNNPIDLI
jgi:hypothetical protein